MKLTEASEEHRISLEKTIKLKQEQLTLKEEETQHHAGQPGRGADAGDNLQLQAEILERYEKLKAAGAFSKCNTSISKTSLPKLAETDAICGSAASDRSARSTDAQLKSDLADLNGRWLSKVTQLPTVEVACGWCDF